MRISAEGGTAESLTRTSGNERAHRNPQFLPDGKTVLFTVTTTETFSYDQARIDALDIETGARRRILGGVRWARHAPSGHLVFARAGTLFAVAFDVARLEMVGDPMPVASGVSMEGFNVHAALSHAGVLAYVPATVAPEGSRRLVWINRRGETQPVRDEPGSYLMPRVSPDGRRIVFVEQRPNNTLWVYDLERGSLSRVPSKGDVISPAWMPDSRAVVYSASEPGQDHLMVTTIDGAREQQVFQSSSGLDPEVVSPDAAAVLTTLSSPTMRTDLWLVPLDG
jgi:Tol biopolymer transport system component